MEKQQNNDNNNDDDDDDDDEKCNKNGITLPAGVLFWIGKQ